METTRHGQHLQNSWEPQSQAFFPRWAPRLRAWAMMGGCILSVVATIQGVRPPAISHYELKLHNLSPTLDGMTLVALSDLHLGSTLGPEWLESRESQVNDMKPDMIFLLGDIFEGHGEDIEAFMPAFQRFSATLGVWSVNGNHENHGKKREFNSSSFAGAKIVTLQDKWIEATPGLLLAGRNTIHNRNEAQVPTPWNPPRDRPPGNLILFSHVPEDSQNAAATGADLMLSGHTHGGQLWPFSLLVAAAHPKLQGRYEVDGMTLLVCRGTGTWGPRMRLWQPSEILHIKSPV